MVQKAGIFTISLDFELHWGGFEKWPLESDSSKGQWFRNYFLNTRKVIPKMLDSMQSHQVHATWATVGLLFHESKTAMDAGKPERLPGYLNQKLSAFYYINNSEIGNDETEDPFHYAPSLIRTISKVPGMEVGSQTYSHYFTSEPGQTSEQFRADLRAANSVAAGVGLKLKSLVLPRNQINSDYLKICSEEGFTSVRINPDDWFWMLDEKNYDSRWKGFLRNLDDLFTIGKETTYDAEKIRKTSDGLLLIPASRFLRPYHSRLPVISDLRLRKVLSEMETAAKKGQVYHLWWHPHNFGSDPEKSMEMLNRILDRYSMLNDKYGMASLNMAELTELIKNQKR